MATLITGADGHLGRALAGWLLDNSDDELVLFCRADSDAERSTKREALATFDSRGRCRFEFGNLRDAQPFESLRPNDIDAIVHAAAVTDFGVPRDAAKAVNVDGTAKLIDFARRCDRLERLCYLGTLYAAGLRDGKIEEAPFDKPAQFANHYEWSKWHAEALLQDCPELPWQVFRVATLLCDDETGAVRQHNVIHNTLRLLYYGLLSVVPGRESTRLYMTTTGAAVEAIGGLMQTGPDHAFFNVSNSGADAMTLAELLDRVYAAFLRDDSFRKHGVLKPRFCDRASFELLAEGIEQFGGAMAQGLDSIAPFAPQLFSDKHVYNDAAHYAPPGLSGLDLPTLVERVCNELVATRWGLRSEDEGARQCA